MSASSQSLRFILILKMNSSFITSRPDHSHLLFERGLPKDHLCLINFKSAQKFLNIYLIFAVETEYFLTLVFFWLPWQPECCMKWKSLNNFEREPLSDHYCDVFVKFKLVVQVEVLLFNVNCKLMMDGKKTNILLSLKLIG